MTYGLSFLLLQLARLRYRGRRRQLVERLARKLGATRRQAQRLAALIP